MKTWCLIVVISANVLADYVSYEGYKVFEVMPRNYEHLSILQLIYSRNDMDFWLGPRTTRKFVAILVPPNFENDLIAIFNYFDMNFRISIENVESCFEAERLYHQALPRSVKGVISFDRYHRYEEIQNYLHTLPNKYPQTVSVENIGRSSEGRNISVIKIGKPSVGKPSILIDGGIYGREWITTAQVLYITQQLVENPSNEAMLENVDWYIIPVANPDGYEYSHVKDRLWKKTRSTNHKCRGVNFNRNFDFHWLHSDASDDPCSDIYAGDSPFSVPETAAFRDFVNQHNDSVKLYISFHGHGRYILFPWSWTSSLARDANDLHELAVDAQKNMEVNDVYTVGSSINILHTISGASDDWIKGVVGVNLSYTVELPGGGNSGFDPNPGDILDVVKGTWGGISIWHSYVEKHFIHVDPFL